MHLAIPIHLVLEASLESPDFTERFLVAHKTLVCGNARRAILGSLPPDFLQTRDVSMIFIITVEIQLLFEDRV